MNAVAWSAGHVYFPAVICGEHDSPIDALVALCVPRAEALDLVAASWWAGEASCLSATLDGGRTVVVLRTLEGRWAACHAFLGDVSTTPEGAAQRLVSTIAQTHGVSFCVCTDNILEFNGIMIV